MIQRFGKLDIAIAVVALLGLADAIYLTYAHYNHSQVLCLSSGGCETVQTSKWSDFGGVPVPVLGLIGYVLILGSLFIRNEVGRAITATMCLGGFGFSLYLTGLELFKIHAICQWCVASAIFMTVLMVLSMWRFLRGEPAGPPPEVGGGDADDEEDAAGDEPAAEPAA